MRFSIERHPSFFATEHELKNVETYIEDMERVRIVASKDKQTISRLTGLSISLVEEYLEIIKTYYPESMHLNRMEGNLVHFIFPFENYGHLI